ncbi:MAG: uracil-DNA glycosylase [Candidatus Azotimanducaceae bacterium]|jgi:uracil-DNA glycosylase
MSDVQLEASWLVHLRAEFEAVYMQELRAFLRQEKAAGKTIYPPGSALFNAFNTTPFDQVKVVILGQDPYHGPGQAHGLSFSVPDGVKPPPSLQNIYKEIQTDIGGEQRPTSGNLLRWAEQGVLLLNSVLTVEAQQAASHQGKGWEQFTDKVIEVVARERQNIVFLLWGSYAQKKGRVINPANHLVLKAPHPSPLSAYRGFLGCGHFSACNRYLMENGHAPIDWLAH